MKKVAVPSFVAGAVSATVLLAVPVAAVVQAGGNDPHPRTFDATTPSLELSPLRFVVGDSIDAAAAPKGDCAVYDSWNYQVPVRMHWTGHDGTAGLAGYDVWQSWEGDTKVLSDTKATSYDFFGSNYLSDCGGGAHNATYYVVATDNRGNYATITDAAHMYLDVWQEDGTTTGWADPLPVVQSGDWAKAHCKCSNQWATYFSTRAGDSLAYTITATQPGQTVGVVARKDTDNGQLTVSIDGGPVTTIDTYSATQEDRVIVWQKTLSVGVHSLTVTNLGTAGHTRVDVDSLLLTRTAG